MTKNDASEPRADIKPGLCGSRNYEHSKPRFEEAALDLLTRERRSLIRGTASSSCLVCFGRCVSRCENRERKEADSRQRGNDDETITVVL